MERIVDEILLDIVRLFQISRVDNILIKRQVSKGFSGAEVYLVELKGDSFYKGNYFLKIDTDNRECENNKKGCCFSKVATVIKTEIIKEYYVMLMEIAGQSSIEFTAFYDIEDVVTRKVAIQKIVEDMLNEETKDENYISDEICATNLFEKQLGTKLDYDGVLREYVARLTRGKSAETVTAFLLDEDIILPNAWAYVNRDDLWKDKKLPNTKCCIHGDLHGDNIFYCKESKEYSLIDFALYRDDGYIFFDMAYFELSLLLHNFTNMELMKWVDIILKMANSDWERIECKGQQSFKSLSDSEKSWINQKCNRNFSYKDNLLQARYVARVIAGMNYAGKKKVNNEIRRKAFLYSCIYMKKLLETIKLPICKEHAQKWQEIEYNPSDNEIDKLLSDVDNFSDSRKYILVLGNKYDYNVSICEALNRVKWTGIVSFRRTEKIEGSLREHNVLNVFTEGSSLDLLTSENLWCVYADGVEYNPKTLYDKFPQWRNKYGTFFNLVAQRLDSMIAPDEIQVLVDLDSFSDDYVNRLIRFCESLDLIGNTNVNISFLSSGKEKVCSNEDFEQIECTYYSTNIETLADFCLKYLAGIQEDEITIPAIHNVRKKIPESEYKFIKTYVTVLHNRIVQYEGQVEEAEKRAFYYGKKILWQAIEEKLYIERKEISEYEEKIKQELDNEENQFLIRIVHSPGAGASVLCRVLAWKFRNVYPVVITECMNKKISESIQKIYSISGKSVLLFLDGDFSENDIAQLMQQARYMGVKVGIVFLYRSYRGGDSQMSILTVNDGMKFLSGYSFQMKEIKAYPEEILKERYENMRKLATTNSLINYRMPFFFGINAFEKDLVSIQDYLDRISSYIDEIDSYKKIINYIALITYYTEGEGLNINYVRKIMNLSTKISAKDILAAVNGNWDNFIYYSDGIFKVCHSVVALEILKHQYRIGSLEFEGFMEQFVHDICSCERSGKFSNYLNNLLMNLFIKRDIEGDIADNLRKKNFSPLIISLENSNLQEKFFSFLISEIPNNAHFRQHYGRLIIYNNSENLAEAKKQFDEAIELEPMNPLHYHSRGNMYTRYVMNLCRNKYKETGFQELYNEIAPLTEEAIADYEKSIQIIIGATDITMDLSYPYASIVQTITYIVHQLFLRYKDKMEEREFLNLNSNVSKWCRSLVQKAEQYDMNTENRYDAIRSNEVYDNVRKHLAKYRHSHSDIAKQLIKRPDDMQLIKDYMYTLDTKKDKWEDKSQDELKRIIECSRKLIANAEGDFESYIWRWFNSSINYEKTDIVEMLALLETLDTNLTVSFMLYTIKVGLYFKNYDSKLIGEINTYINCCKRLSGNSNRTSTRYYYTGQGKVGFGYEKENGIYVNGTVVERESPQNGHVSLDINPKLTAFFVPSVIGMREEGAIGTKVRFKLGVSFDGLRAWDVEVIN